MANEINVRVAVTLKKGGVTYKNDVQSWRENVLASVAKGPCVGVIAVPVLGVDISLAELTTPGLCVFTNQSETNFVTIGTHDGTLFHPLLEIGPGKSYPIMLSRDIGEEHEETGTGSTGTVNTLRAKAGVGGGSVNLLVEAFER